MKSTVLHYREYSKMAILTIALLTILISCQKSMNDMNNSGNNGGNNNNPPQNEVWIQSMAFVPSNISVTAGTTVTWTNKDPVAHTVTSNTNIFDSGTIPANGTYSHMFSSAGSYPYHCTIHPSMSATVTVN